MSANAWVLCSLLATATLLLPQLARVFGVLRGVLFSAVVMGMLGGGWWLLASAAPVVVSPDRSESGSVTASACAKCHAGHYESWHRTYHRTMTRDAAPDTVKGDFNNASHVHQGLKTRFTREGKQFFMETVDPHWALLFAKSKGNTDSLPPLRKVKLSVDRLVGSHWLQECMHRDDAGTLHRLPVLWHVGEQKWLHSNGAFLIPDSFDFWQMCRGTVWNNTCLFCHNTGPASNPVRQGGRVVGYRTEVAELGISCEACHGPGEEHVRINQNPARRLQLQQCGEGDPSIVHPGRLSVQRRDEICARCHGALVPKANAWPASNKDPYLPGLELTRYNHFFWSEAEQSVLAGVRKKGEKHAGTEPIDGRFWGDGTPLTTALEYNGMALSACYEKGKGKLSCTSCHAMHGDEPNHMLKPGMRTNEACYQCHQEYRGKLAEHTKHGADSAGSLCYNCHMPHLVYSLLNTHRSHRIETPDLKTTIETGKPHACNLCHLDKSLGWTQEQLKRWPNRKSDVKVPLSDDDKQIASSLMMLSRGDARTRAMAAGAFSSEAAQKASGTDWFGSFLTRSLEKERYPAVRYLTHRGLRSVHGDDAMKSYDYLALPDQRQDQLLRLRRRFDAVPLTRKLPHLPLTPGGLPDDTILQRLLNQRHDPDLTINE